MWKQSQSTGGFYKVGLHKNIPDDCIDISDSEYQRLIKLPSIVQVSPTLTAAEKKAADIFALERQVTARNLRNAALGDPFAISQIQSIENQIAAIRAG